MTAVPTDDAPPSTGWVDYLRTLTGDVTQAAIAKRANIDQPTVNRWFTGRSEPTWHHVTAVARAYGVNPLDALIAAGHLSTSDLKLPRYAGLHTAPTSALISELARRCDVEV